jgi:hypothetical protein
MGKGVFFLINYMNIDELHEEISEDVGGHASNGQLPQFLNVLTILTFIGSGLALIRGLYNIATPDQQQASIDLMKSMPQVNPFGADAVLSMQAMLDNLYLMQGSAILFAIMCILGAYMMRKLNKTGFYLYLIASIGSIVLPIAVIGFGIIGVIVLLASVITISFVIMYGVNFKYLK